MWDVIGAAVLIICLLVWWGIAFFGGALAEAREKPGWVPGNEPTDTPFDIAEIYAHTAVCIFCGEVMGEVTEVVDGQGHKRRSGFEEVAELQTWHQALDCQAVRA